MASENTSTSSISLCENLAPVWLRGKSLLYRLKMRNHIRRQEAPLGVFLRSLYPQLERLDKIRDLGLQVVTGCSELCLGDDGVAESAELWDTTLAYGVSLSRWKIDAVVLVVFVSHAEYPQLRSAGKSPIFLQRFLSDLLIPCIYEDMVVAEMSGSVIFHLKEGG